MTRLERVVAVRGLAKYVARGGLCEYVSQYPRSRGSPLNDLARHYWRLREMRFYGLAPCERRCPRRMRRRRETSSGHATKAPLAAAAPAPTGRAGCWRTCLDCGDGRDGRSQDASAMRRAVASNRPTSRSSRSGCEVRHGRRGGPHRTWRSIRPPCRYDWKDQLERQHGWVDGRAFERDGDEPGRS